ncbi:MAG TPA: class I SAM-dependent methyltransferase [Gemmatimonadaceae bacterium]|nr:class I SAM-dependent methyltransferase [Gemmatimonadaceae bacterium]
MEPAFDGCADRYEEELAQGLSVTGEGMDYYARERLRWVRRLVERDRAAVNRVLDFGCGVGRATPYLFEILGAQDVVGVDVSTRSLEKAREQYASAHARFVSPADIDGTLGPFDLAFTNGVFHHIPPAQRAAAVRFVHDALRPGGVFAFWENNPWNPGTRYIMSRVSFDADAITLPPPESRALLRGAGFQVLGTTSRFYFPRSLALLRGLEPALASLPLGGQYLVWCRRPS